MYHFILDMPEIGKIPFLSAFFFLRILGTLVAEERIVKGLRGVYGYAHCSDRIQLLFYMGHIQICYFRWSGSAGCDTCMGQDNKRAGNSQTLDGV